jgi:uncharacterized protein
MNDFRYYLVIKKMKYFIKLLLLLPVSCFAQKSSYVDSINLFIKKYVDSHQVVNVADKAKMQFFPVHKKWRVSTQFEKRENAPWFMMSTSGKNKKEYRVYGTVSFLLNDTLLKLNIYQSKQLIAQPEYANYLFIPFTDKTSGIDTYGGGRYIDLVMEDIKGNNYVIDFNKAYNPYCAYTAGYNCPIPPKENDLPIAVLAGEKNFAGH